MSTPEPKAGLPAVVQLPDDFKARLALVEECWARLTEKQRLFLAAWRDCRFNARAACKQTGLSENTRPMTGWMRSSDFATVVRVWRAHAAADALDRDRLLARQDDIVETLLTPKPVLHQGVPVLDPRRPGEILEEVDAGAASRANEVLLDRVMPKPRADVEVNVGVVAFAPPRVEVEGASDDAIDAQCEVVEASVVLPSDDEWLST